MNSTENPPEAPEAAAWQRLALTVCMFLITATFGFIQPFVPLYMEASKLTRGQIGLVVGAGTGLALLIQPVLGRLSDRLDTRRPFMAGAAIVAGLAYLGYRGAHGVPAFLALTALGVNGTMYLNAAGGALIGRLTSGVARGGALYAGYRLWGSVGYIVVTLLTGLLVTRGMAPHAGMDRAQLETVFTYCPLLFFGIAAVVGLVPDRKNPVTPLNSALLPRREYAPLSLNLRWFLFSYFLYSFALYGASAYLSLFMKSLGASPLWITGMFAAGVVCEVLVMRQAGRFSDRYGRRPALAMAYVLMPLRLLCYIPATGPFWVLMVQTLHGFNFGIMGAIAVVFVNDLATDTDRGQAQARLAAVGGLANATGPAACGVLAQVGGIGGMFFWMAVVGIVAATVFLLRVHDSHPAAEDLARRGPAFLRPILRLLDAPPKPLSTHPPDVT